MPVDTRAIRNMAAQNKTKFPVPKNMADLRTLTVSPKTDLLMVEAEVAAVVNHLHASILTGQVTSENLLSKLEEQWDIVWFATHGDENGIYLSDGPISSDVLVPFMRTANASLIVLNTCSSINVAQDIYNELSIDLVCAIRPIPDRQAFFTAKQFAFNLSRGLSPYDAYVRAKPGRNRDYVFLGRGNSLMPLSAIDEREYQRMSQELGRLVRLIDGEERDQEPGLLRVVKETAEDVQRLKTDFSFVRFGIWIVALSSIVITAILVALLITGRG